MNLLIHLLLALNSKTEMFRESAILCAYSCNISDDNSVTIISKFLKIFHKFLFCLRVFPKFGTTGNSHAFIHIFVCTSIKQRLDGRLTRSNKGLIHKSPAERCLHMMKLYFMVQVHLSYITCQFIQHYCSYTTCTIGTDEKVKIEVNKKLNVFFSDTQNKTAI